MRAPDFWYQPASRAARLLAPFGYLYDIAGMVRRAVVRPANVAVPVICVGNLVAGGAGKTPVALAIGSLLREHQPHFLTRGYGGRLTGPVRVDPARHTAADVGDEALLLAVEAPTWLARNRAAGARAAVRDGAGIVIMDDGFQNPGLKKDISLIVIDGATGFGNDRVIPAGPLREFPVEALKRAQGIVLIGEDHTRLAGRLPAALPLFGARLVPSPAADNLSGHRVVAFAGIGRPQKFFDTLDALGCTIVEQHAFADHHPYSDDTLDELVFEAAGHDAILVTTAKDAVRLNDRQLARLRDRLRVVDVTLEWEGEASIRRFLSGLR